MPADDYNNPRYQQRNTQQYASRFADPHGSNHGSSQIAFGNSQTGNDKNKYAVKRSNIPSS